MRIQLRKTHPNLYRSATVFGLVGVALGLNFRILSPPFDQYNLGQVITAIFGLTGAIKLFVLNVTLNLRHLRAIMAFGVALQFFYGCALGVFTITTGRTSMNLPIMYFALAALQYFALIEPAFNPVTAKVPPPAPVPDE